VRQMIKNFIEQNNILDITESCELYELVIFTDNSTGTDIICIDDNNVTLYAKISENEISADDIIEACLKDPTTTNYFTKTDTDHKIRHMNGSNFFQYSYQSNDCSTAQEFYTTVNSFTEIVQRLRNALEHVIPA